ncbi:MAG TPA: endolytic transglycosylase MltG [Gaiellaceae bacterium]|jgi:uncharacterized YceG family protein
MAKHAFVAGLVALSFAAAGCGSASSASPTTSTIVQLHQFEIIFPEGYTRLQMADEVKLIATKADRERHGRVQISKPAYLRGSTRAVVRCFGKKPQTNLEGFLFPAGYNFDVKTTGPVLAGDQIQAFCENWATLNLSYAHSKNLTDYDVLKIASMVEAEVAVPSERVKVAAVIYNRLRAGMPLQIDATLRYGLHIKPTQSITQSELASDSPYNTRKNPGLPPTPIGNPGLASLQAAAHPSNLGYLYYARIPGTNPPRQKFFESYSQYQAFLATHGYGPHS